MDNTKKLLFATYTIIFRQLIRLPKTLTDFIIEELKKNDSLNEQK